jgi:hypothetical protein
MGLLDKLIPNEVKKVFKPVAKLSKKFLPKEIRPWLPMVTPFLPATGIMGAMGGMGGFGKMYLANLLTQQMADPEAEFDDLNQFAALLAGTQGGLTGTETAQNLRDKTTYGKAIKGSDMIGPVDSSTLADRSLLTKASDLGKNITALGSDYLTDNMGTLRDVGAGRMPLNLATAKEVAKAGAIPFSEGMGGVTEAYQRPAIREFEKQEADDQAEFDATSTADKQERADLTMRYYREAGHDEETIQTALEVNDLSEFYEPPVTAAQGGIIGLRNGGMLNFGGREMDLRTGGFVPIGRQERADDVPARLSKNEFVMTADAVRAAGGGSVNKGAQRMYDIMNKLEARA